MWWNVSIIIKLSLYSVINHHSDMNVDENKMRTISLLHGIYNNSPNHVDSKYALYPYQVLPLFHRNALNKGNIISATKHYSIVHLAHISE